MKPHFLLLVLFAILLGALLGSTARQASQPACEERFINDVVLIEAHRLNDTIHTVGRYQLRAVSPDGLETLGHMTSRTLEVGERYQLITVIPD